MRRVRPAAARVAYGLALFSAIFAVALSLRGSPAHFLALAVAAVLVLFVPYLEWTSPPAPLVRVLPRLAALVLLVVVLAAWISRSMSFVDFDASLLPSAAAPFLVPIAAAFALSPSRFQPARTLVPATIGLLVLAGLNPTPPGYGGSVLPFLQAAAHSAFSDFYLGLTLVALGALWTAALVPAGPRWRRRDLVPLLAGLAFTTALAAAGVVGLPLLQPRIERAVASMLDQGSTGLSNESTLGEFAELGSSNKRVLDLRTSRPTQPPPRLRSEVFTSFDGRRWSGTAASAGRRSTILQPMPPPPGVGPLLADTGAWFRLLGAGQGAASEIRVVQAVLDRWPLLLPKGVAAVTTDAAYLELDRMGLVRRPAGIPAKLYGALWPSPIRPSAELSDEERRESLTLPPHVDPRVAALARELASGRGDPAARVRATVEHLQTRYRYTLRPGAFRTADPLAEFLFDKRAGYCEYFASAAAVLLRLQGVPARFVKGLSVGPHTDEGGGLHVVRDRDAHAWLEVWLADAGWVEEDPTPADQFAAAHPPPSRLDRAFERTRAALASAWAFLTARGPLVFLRKLAADAGRLAARLVREPLAWVFALALAAAALVVRWWRARARRLPPPAGRDEAEAVPAELRGLVAELERRWRSLGHPRPPGRGLLEHATSPTTPLGVTGTRIVRLYYEVRYGGVTVASNDLTALREHLSLASRM